MPGNAMNSSVSTAKDLSRLALASPEEVVREFLSYGDMPGLSAATREEYATATLALAKSRAYAVGLSRLVITHGAEVVASTVRAMLLECHDTLACVPIVVSQWGRSRTWACWDMGKQNYYMHHPQEARPGYSREDPIASPGKFHEIVDRHVGWEVYAVRHRAAPLFEGYAKRAEVIALLLTDPTHKYTLSSKALATLGRLIRIEIGGIGE